MATQSTTCWAAHVHPSKTLPRHLRTGGRWVGPEQWHPPRQAWASNAQAQLTRVTSANAGANADADASVPSSTGGRGGRGSGGYVSRGGRSGGYAGRGGYSSPPMAAGRGYGMGGGYGAAGYGGGYGAAGYGAGGYGMGGYGGRGGYGMGGYGAGGGYGMGGYGAPAPMAAATPAVRPMYNARAGAGRGRTHSGIGYSGGWWWCTWQWQGHTRIGGTCSKVRCNSGLPSPNMCATLVAFFLQLFWHARHTWDWSTLGAMHAGSG
eukprot:16795-Pelagomonas_calceolata.AAC.10